MNFEDALPLAGIRDLRSFTDAWAIEVVRRDDKADYVQRILESRHDILTTQRLETHLRFADIPYRTLMLVRAVLRQLLNEPKYIAPTTAFHEKLIAQEQHFSEWALRPNALKHLDPKSVDIYRTVLKDAWDSDGIDNSEFRLLEVLRKKLGFTRRDHRVVELQLGHLPGAHGTTNTVDEIEQAVVYLLKRGVVLRIQSVDGGARSYCIPEEIGDAIREIMGIELQAPAYTKLLEKLPVSVLRSALEASDQPFSGTGEFLIDRLIDGYVSPRVVLRQLTDDQLTALLKNLASLRPDGTKEIRVRNIVKYYDRLEFTTSDPVTGTGPPGEAYVKYYLDLAWRRQGVLRAASVITKDLQIERRFEEATTALFTEHLGHPVERMEGSNHPDGHVNLSDPRRVLIWDCKSCEAAYSLTDRTARQFLAYATAVAPRVASPMLIIGPDFTADSVPAAMRLKAQCAPGTEICLIRAEDLLWLADAWKHRLSKAKTASPLPWEVLSFTGRMTQDLLKQRLKTFSG
jgi:hypothetical protein